MLEGEALRATSDVLEGQLSDMATRLRRTLRDSVPGYSADLDPALAALESTRITEALRSLIAALRGDDEPGDAILAAAATEARAAAQAGVELDALIQTYRVLQSTVWDDVLSATSRSDWPATEQLAVQKYVAELNFRWSDTVVAGVVDTYQAEQRNFFYQSRDRRLRAALRALLARRTDLLDHSDYPLAGEHVAAVIWGDQRRGTLDAIASTIGARSALSVDGSSATTLAWFALPVGVDDRAGIEAITPAEGSYVAVGNAGRGPEGFRTSHFQAWRAYRVGRFTGAAIAHYHDVALESLFLQDADAARDLVTHQLGPLDLSDPRTEVLCDTIRAYFASGCNAAKAAAELQVHERTVAYRLRTVEDRLGVDVVDRRVELLTALRLLPALRADSAGLSPKPSSIRL